MGALEPTPDTVGMIPAAPILSWQGIIPSDDFGLSFHDLQQLGAGLLVRTPIVLVQFSRGARSHQISCDRPWYPCVSCASFRAPLPALPSSPCRRSTNLQLARGGLVDPLHGEARIVVGGNPRLYHCFAHSHLSHSFKPALSRGSYQRCQEC